jgi:hypothetical protein
MKEKQAVHGNALGQFHTISSTGSPTGRAIIALSLERLFSPDSLQHRHPTRSEVCGRGARSAPARTLKPDNESLCFATGLATNTHVQHANHSAQKSTQPKADFPSDQPLCMLPAHHTRFSLKVPPWVSHGTLPAHNAAAVSLSFRI